jgi:hypothetical protein
MIKRVFAPVQFFEKRLSIERFVVNDEGKVVIAEKEYPASIIVKNGDKQELSPVYRLNEKFEKEQLFIKKGDPLFVYTDNVMMTGMPYFLYKPDDLNPKHFIWFETYEEAENSLSLFADTVIKNQFNDNITLFEQVHIGFSIMPVYLYVRPQEIPEEVTVAEA